MSGRNILPKGEVRMGVVTEGRSYDDSRICFSIMFFEQESDADKVATEVRKRGRTYNGGFFHGSPCGREKGYDYVDKDGVRWHAVTW